MENSDYKKTGSMKTKKQISIKPFIRIHILDFYAGGYRLV